MPLDQIANAKVNPVFNGLSDRLKDPKNFLKIEKKIAATMVSDHKHRLVSAFNKCKRCQAKFLKKREVIKEQGFESVQQYQNWKKVMDIIRNKKNLHLYARQKD